MTISNFPFRPKPFKKPMNATGTGVQRLLSVLGIDESEAMACGDAVNDVEMLKLVAKGVAMGISDVFYQIHKPKRKTLLGGMVG